MRCCDLRWKLSSFLEGNLALLERDEIRRHLDLCGSCVAYFVKSGKLEKLPTEINRLAASGFADRVLSALPNRSRAGLLTRYFVSIVIATSLFAIAVFAFLRPYYAPSPLTPSAEESALVRSIESMLPWLEQAVASPLIQLVFFSLLATLISIALIALIDNPSHPLRRGKS